LETDLATAPVRLDQRKLEHFGEGTTSTQKAAPDGQGISKAVSGYRSPISPFNGEGF
jgi:hypothetical protein